MQLQVARSLIMATPLSWQDIFTICHEQALPGQNAAPTLKSCIWQVDQVLNQLLDVQCSVVLYKKQAHYSFTHISDVIWEPGFGCCKMLFCIMVFAPVVRDRTLACNTQ